MTTWASLILDGGWDKLSPTERLDMLNAIFNNPRAQAGERMVQS